MRHSPPEAGRLRRYGMALVAVAVATLLTNSTWPLLKPTPWALCVVAVMAAAWQGGSGPGLVATVALAIIGRLLFIEPYGTLASGWASIVPVLSFLLVAVCINLLASARKKAIAFEQAERKRFQATVTSIGDAVIATDAAGCVSFMNAVAEELTAWKLADAKGKPLEEVFLIINEYTREITPNPVAKVFETGSIQGLANHTVLIARDGSERPIDDSAAPIRNDRGEITGVVLVFHDVSEKHAAAKKLAESEEYSRRIIESSTDCLKVLDLEGRLQLMNQNGCRLMEIDDFAPFVHRSWAELWPVDSRGMAEEALEQARAGKIGHFEGACPTAKGTDKWWDVAVSPVLDAEGKVVRFLSTSRDISDRKQSEDELRTREERYRTLFESIDEGFCIIEVDFDASEKPIDYRVIEMNPAFEEHTGLRGVVGKSIRECVPELDEFWYETYGRVALTGETNRFVSEAKALEDRWFDVTASKLGGPDSRKVAVLFKNITAKKLAEQEREQLLREVENERGRLSDVFQRAPSFMCVLSGPEHVFERINDRYYQLVGHRDIIGKTVREALPDVAGQGFFELLDGVYQTGEPFVGEGVPIRLVRNPGDTPEERFLDFVYQPIRESSGSISGIMVQGIDLTERKRAEDEVRSKTERLNLLVENTQDYAVIITDLDGTITEWQGGTERITGYTAEEAIGQKAHLIFTPEDRADGRPEYEMSQSALTGRAEDKRWHLRKDGTRFFADGVMMALYDEGEKLHGFGKVFKDATGEKLATEATKRRAFQLQKLADIANRINSAHDISSVLGVITSEARTLFGAHRAATNLVPIPHHPQPLVSVSDSGVYPPVPDLTDFGIVDILKSFGSNNEPLRLSQDELLAQPDWRALHEGVGSGSLLNGWLAVPLVGRSGKVIGLLQLSDKEKGEFTEDDEAILRQLSQLAAIAIQNARLYQELRSNDERKDEFLAMLAHELRNPLAAISNAVKLSARTDLAEHREWSMEVITRQMVHLTRLIDDLMDVSRITRGKIELRREVLDATPILKSAAATVKTLVDERKHSLELAIEEVPLWVKVDPTRLEQVIVNLLNNAAKYSENEGNIRLSARREGGQVVISIKDKGVGIPPERLPEMFELFSQGDRSLARSEGGLGIGLTVVKKLVEMHGGTIAAESEGLGKGSEFVIRLPLAQKQDARQSTQKTSGGEPVKTARILVVDDNEDTARGMARLLKLIGYEVKTAHNGPDAIEVAKELNPEFILLDIGLPGMSGYEVAAQLRREECCKDALIVAISGYGQPEDRRHSKEAGFDYHLTKPLDHDALLALLAAS